MSSVLLTNFYADLGGGEMALLAHASWLRAGGTDVQVLLFHPGPLEQRLRRLGCNVEVLATRLDCGPRGALVKSLTLRRRLNKVIRVGRPEYILVYTSHELPFVAEAARRNAVRVFYRDQTSLADQAGSRDWRLDWLLSKGSKTLCGVFPTTQTQFDYLKLHGVPTSKLALVYLGIDADRFDASRDNTSLRRELGISQETCLVGMFGRLIAWKGQETFLRALQYVRGDFHALIVGGPQLNEHEGKEYYTKLHNIVVSLGLENCVTCTGFRDDVPDLMRACDVVAHASVREPFGLVLVEAAMCGKPVIASDVSGPREIVVPVDTGYLFPPGDAEAMGDCLARLLTDPDQRARMGKVARNRAIHWFDHKTNLAALDREINNRLRDCAGQGKRWAAG